MLRVSPRLAVLIAKRMVLFLLLRIAIFLLQNFLAPLIRAQNCPSDCLPHAMCAGSQGRNPMAISLPDVNPLAIRSFLRLLYVGEVNKFLLLIWFNLRRLIFKIRKCLKTAVFVFVVNCNVDYRVHSINLDCFQRPMNL